MTEKKASRLGGMEGTLGICEKAQAKLLICLRIRREKPKAVPTPKIAKGEGTAVDGVGTSS